MEDFDDNPLDILDGNDALEMALFFDKDEEGKSRKPGDNNSGCSVVLVFAAAAISTAIWGLGQLVVGRRLVKFYCQPKSDKRQLIIFGNNSRN